MSPSDAPARWAATLSVRRGAPGEDQASAIRSVHARGRWASDEDGLSMDERFLMPADGGFCAVERRHVDLQRTCSALCSR